MIFIPVAVLVGIVSFQLWQRLLQVQDTIVGLTARVDRLERLRSRDDRTDLNRNRATAAPTPQLPPATLSAPPPRPAPRRAAPSVPPVVRPAVSPVVPPVLAATTPVPAGEYTADAIETRIGARWLLYVGIVAIVVGVAYFEKLAIDNHWISDTARVVQGAVLGLAFVVGGTRFTRAGYRLYGQLISGCGIAVLYVVGYAAFNLYHLVSQMTAFVLMSAITLLVAWLADLQRSQGLALVAVGGGFATPFLVGSGADAEMTLFGYDAILIGGTMLLSRRRDWPTLNVTSYGFTVLTVGAWMAAFYNSSMYLTTEIFLTLFCAMFLYILSTARRSSHPAAQAERAVLWTAPFLYYGISLIVLGLHSTALLVFVVLLALCGALAGARAGARVHLAFCAATAVPLLLWSTTQDAAFGWLAPGLIAWTAVYLLNLAGLIERTRRAELSPADIALIHVNAAAAFVGAAVMLHPAHLAARAPLAAIFGLSQAVPAAIRWRRQRESALQFAAPAFTSLSAAVALAFDAPWVTTAWIAEGAALMWLGLAGGRMWLRLAGLASFSIGLATLTTIEFSEPLAGQRLLLNDRAGVAVFVIAVTYALAWAHDKSAPQDRDVESGAGLVIAKLLILGLAASEIVAYWQLHTPPPFEPASQLVVAGFFVGAVVMALGLRRRQEWMRGIGGLVVAASAFGLFSTQLEPAPAGYPAVLNARAAAGIFAVIVLYVLTRLHRRFGEAVADLPINVGVLTTVASLLTLSLLTSEINVLWPAGGALDAWSITRDALRAMTWAALGGFVVWRGLLERQTWIRIVGGLVLGIGVVRFVMVELADPGLGYLIAANSRVLTALAVIAILSGLARLYRGADDVAESAHGMVAGLRLAANAIALVLLTSEIAAYWHLRDLRYVSAPTDSFFAREMMLSITWAVYATILIVVGLKRRYAPIRYFAIAVFAGTIVKVFAVDLADLDRLYRVASIIGLGILLLLTAFLYQRLRIGDAAEARR